MRFKPNKPSFTLGMSYDELLALRNCLKDLEPLSEDFRNGSALDDFYRSLNELLEQDKYS